mmetsp:Transcript_28555/g.60259  ORF Transcript_28555/g.60259 Transcript_28555/m.60259 type:complete len:485 (+) Transcript_28555:190-1644(+)
MVKQIISTLALAAVCATNVIYYKHPATNEAKVIEDVADESLPPLIGSDIALDTNRKSANGHRRLLGLHRYRYPKTVSQKTTDLKTTVVTSRDDLEGKDSSTDTSDVKRTQKNKPKAVLHIGPPKSGTTAVQSSIRQSAHALIKDGFTMPWFIKKHDKVNELGFATCFESNVWTNWEDKCPEGELSLLKQLGEEGKNIFLSSEFFSFITNPDELADFLKAWDVTIVYFHRWYYDWQFSQYNQSLKSRLEKKLANFEEFIAARGSGNAHILPFDRFFSRMYRRDFLNELESYNAVYKYRQHFDDVVTLDYKDASTSVTENLFCNGMRNASNTCEHFQRQKGESTVKNRAVSMVYKNIAYGTNQLALASYCSRPQFDDVVKKIQDHQEKVLGLSSSDFPMKCLEDEILDKMLEVSVEHRRRILLDDPFTKEEEDQLREEYWENIKKKACDPDIVAILEMPEWLKFFDALEKDTSCHVPNELSETNVA